MPDSWEVLGGNESSCEFEFVTKDEVHGRLYFDYMPFDEKISDEMVNDFFLKQEPFYSFEEIRIESVINNNLLVFGNLKVSNNLSQSLIVFFYEIDYQVCVITIVGDFETFNKEFFIDGFEKMFPDGAREN